MNVPQPPCLAELGLPVVVLVPGGNLYMGVIVSDG